MAWRGVALRRLPWRSGGACFGGLGWCLRQTKGPDEDESLVVSDELPHLAALRVNTLERELEASLKRTKSCCPGHEREFEACVVRT